MNADRIKLIELIRKLSYKEGNFTLVSGKQSSFYVDLKNVTLHPKGADLVGKMACQMLDLNHFGAVGGPTLGADPIATAISLAAFHKGIEIPAYIIRKEAKKHGTSQWIEGRENIKDKANLLLVEDVVTTGGSSLKAVEKIRAEGFTVDTVLCILDRLEGGREHLKESGLSLISLATIDEIKNAR